MVVVALPTESELKRHAESTDMSTDEPPPPPRAGASANTATEGHHPGVRGGILRCYATSIML